MRDDENNAAVLISLDRRQDVLLSRVRVYELLMLETTLGGKTSAMPCDPRQFVVLSPKRKKERI